MASAMYQAFGMRRHGRSTMSQTVSVTCWKYLDASAGLLLLMGLPELRVGVADAGEEHVARQGVQLRQHGVGARSGVERRDPAALVVEVAEHDGARRTGLLAGRHDLAVLDRTLLVL